MPHQESFSFILSQRGIEIDPAKAKAIIEMPPPQREKEGRGFDGRIEYYSRFIARLTPICEPILKLLRKNSPGQWNEECQKAFELIKPVLMNPPVLVPPVPGRPL